MLTGAANFVLDLKEGKRPWLILLGTSGAGKTHIARRIWKYWKQTASWTTAQGRGGQMSNFMRSGSFELWADVINEARAGKFGVFERLMSDEFVILDDIGAGEDARKWISDKLYHVIEKRIPENKSLILTANLSLEQIADEYDPRIASRLLRRGKGFVIEVNVPDYCAR